MSLNGKKIGVLMGGKSSEREISLKSGRAVLKALQGRGLCARALEVMLETEEEMLHLISANEAEALFVAMHGGFGEDGRLQALLEKIGIPFTGPKAQASKFAMDKVVAQRLFMKAGLRVPKHRAFRKLPGKWGRFILNNTLRYPLVVKPSSQGSSIGISFIDAPAQLDAAMLLAFKFDKDVLVEEFICGREITVSVLDGKALPVVEIIPKKKFFDYQAKYEKGLTEYVVPAHLPGMTAHCAQQDAVRAYQVLGCCHLSRVDMIVGDDGALYVLEVNTIPGMTETSLLPKAALAAGIAFDELCVKLLELACHGKK